MKAIIIDDERLARTELKKLLQEFPEVEVVDEAANADEGISKIESQQPDLIFLDIQMPGKSVFDMLLQLERAPQVIFTTALATIRCCRSRKAALNSPNKSVLARCCGAISRAMRSAKRRRSFSRFTPCRRHARRWKREHARVSWETRESSSRSS